MINKFREQGNLFVIATGRSYDSLNQKLDKYNISFDYLILSNGTIVLDKDKNVILSYNIDNITVRTIVEDISNFKDIDIKLFDLYSEDVQITNDFITKIRIMTKTYEEAKSMALYINNKYIEVKAYPIDAKEYKFVEIISANTDKSKAIEKIIEIEQLETDYVYTIGDGINDIEMIEKYDGYCMINSEQEVLDVTNKRYNNVYNLIEEILYK